MNRGSPATGAYATQTERSNEDKEAAGEPSQSWIETVRSDGTEAELS